MNEDPGYIKQYAELVAKAWKDSDFLSDLKRDPVSILRDLGIHVPDGHTVEIHEDSNTVSHIVIPVKPSGLLVKDYFHEDVPFFYRCRGATSDGR